MPAVFSTLILLATVAFQAGPVADAVSALQHGDLSGAEQTLRAEADVHPRNADALGVLAVVLDQEKKYPEAGEMYRRAAALSPRSPGLLNNYGNHLLATGKPLEARAAFLKVLALDPAHANARAQLARLALEAKRPAEALRYLDGATPNPSPDVTILRMQALYALHRDREADVLLDGLSGSGGAENVSLAVALASVGQYGRAESFFSTALEAKPDDLETLHNLGLAAAHAGHNERAREVLQRALERQPQNADLLYDLAAVDVAMNHDEAALELLVQAAKISPERADIQRLLAHTAGDLGYFGDAVKAWDRYLAMVPLDETAARDRAFAMTALGDDTNRGITGLQAYVRKHPQDAIGHFELGAAEAPTDLPGAARELNRAIAIQPDLVAARVARGLLHYRQGDNAGALPDFEFAAKRDPESAIVLDRLGQTYMALDRPAEAVPVLRKAAQLAPRDSRMLLHLGRALSSTGDQSEAETVLARVRELGADKSSSPHPAGLVDFLNLPPAEQFSRYRAGVERTVAKNPDNAEAEVRYLELLLSDGNVDEAAAITQKLLNLHPTPFLLAEAADALVGAEQYGLARDLLGNGALADEHLLLDQALIAFHLESSQAGLKILDRIPESARQGDYYLARVQMLVASGEDPSTELDRALATHPARPELYRQTVVLLTAHGRKEQARRLLDVALRTLPENAGIQMLALQY